MANTDIRAESAPANPYNDGPFRQVSDMEDHLCTIRDMLTGIMSIASTVPDVGGALDRIAGVALDRCEAAQELRGELFRLTHPRREHFEKVGWPSIEVGA